MRLSKLTLSGFKSFADRTEFVFDDAVVGIVGPNGCGKSNVVDAIKWVLGERSSKSLRGKEMMDVVFAGSAGRKPGGMASVTLTFDNPVIDESVAHAPATADSTEGVLPEGTSPDEPAAEPSRGPVIDGEAPSEASGLIVQSMVGARRRRGLPVDTDVVEVERRLYRDGASQYLINGRRARLKDIRDLFLDTGIGADAYSIIEQGKVDAMLLSSPQERRAIFEEAAGVAKYKQRRIEAERKLERTAANLTLTREQLENTERRLRLVRGQAAKARKFKELDELLRASRTALAFDQYHDIRLRLEGLTSQLAALETARAETAAALEEAERDKQEADLARQDVLDRRRSLEQARTQAEHAKETAEQRRAITQRSLVDAERQVEQATQRLGEIDGRLQTLLTSAEEQAQRIETLAHELSTAENELKSAAEAKAAAMEQLTEKRLLVDQHRRSAASIDRERASLQGSADADQRRAEQLQEQIQRLNDRRASAERESAELAERSVAAKAAVEARQSALATMEGQLASREQQAASLSSDRRDRSARVAELETRRLKLDSRRGALEEMAASREGLGDTVKAILDARDAGAGFAGVVGPLAELIRPEAELASVIELALGELLRAVVVESMTALPTAAELAGLPGRVSLVPLAGAGAPAEAGGVIMPPDEIAPRVVALRRGVSASVNGERGLAVEALLDRVLGRTVLVESIDAALMLAAGPMAGAGARYVTRDGCVLEPDGRVLAGPASSVEASGVLRRKVELEALLPELAELTESLQMERVALAAVDSSAAKLSDDATDLRRRIAADQRTLAHEQAAMDRLAADAARLQREHANLTGELDQLAARAAKIAAEQAGLRQRIESLARLHQEQVDLGDAAAGVLTTLQTRAEAAGEGVTAIQVRVGRLGEQLRALKREHHQLLASREDAERQRRSLAEHAAQAADRAAEHRCTINDSTDQAERAAEQAEGLASQISAVAAELATVDAAASETAQRVQAARAQATHVERDWHSVEVARRELEVKRETLEERAASELSIQIAAEYAEYREMLADGGVAELDAAATQAEIDELRDAVRKLGNVNLDAIEEETQLAGRNDELIKQVADLDAARASLSELIERLNAVSKQLFGEVFAKIQEHFGSPNGMFRRLFGGGKGEVRLMPLVKEVQTEHGVEKVQTDEIDVLESGVEIIAKPPGKEPRTIDQLSGGEKTLTAVALLLSIFQSKPSCFCILDEVDAALDESNVGRYNQVVRQFTSHSHFIVITHNKRTMQSADRLYGITMQERGVSTRVSVKFEQVGADGRIKTAAAPAAMMDAPAPVEPEIKPTTKPGGVLRRALAAMHEDEARTG